MDDDETPPTPFGTWVDSLDEGWWDDAADAGGILDSLQEAFEAGWKARGEKIETDILGG
jgi:hypothetical protein